MKPIIRCLELDLVVCSGVEFIVVNGYRDCQFRCKMLKRRILTRYDLVATQVTESGRIKSGSDGPFVVGDVTKETDTRRLIGGIVTGDLPPLSGLRNIIHGRTFLLSDQGLARVDCEARRRVSFSGNLAKLSGS